MDTRLTPFRRIVFMAAIVIAGEAIFGLPFLIPRVFRPTVLAVLGIDNLQLGTAFSLYGVVAMLSYFPGGPIADRFSAQRLMSAALLATALGGVYYASIPSLRGLKFLFAFWGLTTILLFWAAMIRATREWGGDESQGKAFGILDGGRGLLAAVLGTTTTIVLGMMLPIDAASATLEQKTVALKAVIWIFTGMAIGAAVLVWSFVPESTVNEPKHSAPKMTLKSVAGVLRNRAVWLQGAIVVCAYTGYKGSDDFGLFARDAFGFDDVKSAGVGTLSLWVRPLAAFGAGALADRIDASRAVLLCFLALIVGDLVVALGLLSPSMPWMLYSAVFGTSAMVYGLRGVYFALFEEAKVPAALTGTAAGLVSVIGYTPDIFMSPLMGLMTKVYPGPLGHQYFFGELAGFATIGLLATWLFQRSVRSEPRTR